MRKTALRIARLGIVAPQVAAQAPAPAEAPTVAAHGTIVETSGLVRFTPAK